MGCSIQQHKWQKLKMSVRVDMWGRLTKRVLTSIGGVAASISALAATMSAFVALGALIAK
ncbi:hypothetical protein CFN78_27785 [Amycolatopsis antarctica]|uniref:Uncharacterized protein n=2 Tax=Amycolatopsis antarctica TaxID=1854586 RepID=A0A263CV21_9PSEU|nr:hypothetical protein CFN78_27785 [Amycolatopsis antarctica]